MAGKRDSILRAAVTMVAHSGVRGLRVEEVAAAAGVSTGLIYYHFKDRAGLLRATLDHVNDRAGNYTVPTAPDARTALEQRLLLELQDLPEIRENSTAWGELRASAIFEDGLRERLAEATRIWVEEIAELVEAARAAAAVGAPGEAAHSSSPAAAPGETAHPSHPTATAPGNAAHASNPTAAAPGNAAHASGPAAATGEAAHPSHIAAPTPARPTSPAADVAERLTALVEGLSERWLSGTLDLHRARGLVLGAVTAELGG
ncbi:TetR/AcrR family transcriptional regulator [Amycolatopsis sp. NPDC004378]